MTKEEVIIAMGLDNSQASKGLNAFNFIAQESIEDTLKGVKRLVGINMVEVGMKVMEVWNDATKFIANQIFDIDRQIAEGRGIDKFRKKVRDLFKDLTTARAELDKQVRELTFERADPEQQFQMLSDERELAKIREDEALKEERRLRETKKAFEVAGMAAEAKDLIEPLAKAEKLRLKATVERLDAEKEIVDVVEKIEEQRKRNLKEAVELVKDRERVEKAINDQRERANVAERNLDRSLQRSEEFTLEELANSKFLRGTPWQRQAMDIINLRRWAKENRMAGFFDRGEFQSRRASQLFDDLAKKNPFLHDPFQDLLRNADEQLGILAKMESKGLMIRNSE